MKKKFLLLFDYFFVLRPTLFFPVWTVSLAGYWAYERAVVAPGWHLDFPGHHFDDLGMIFYLGMLTLLMGAAFLINQLTDVESDRLNNKLYLIASGAIPVKHAEVQSGLLVLVPLGLLFANHLPVALCAVLIFALTGWAYSCKPLALKNRPWGGLLANLGGSLLIFSFGWLIKGAFSWALFLHALPYIFGVGAVYLLTTIPDLPGDRATGKVTVAVRYDSKRVLRAAVFVDGAAVVLALFMQDFVALTATLLAWPFFYQAARRGDVDAVLRTNKYATLILSLLICWRFPLYLVLLMTIFFVSRWYYAARFKVNYPSLRT